MFFTSTLRPCPSTCRICLLFLKGESSKWNSHWLLSQYPACTMSFLGIFPDPLCESQVGSLQEKSVKGWELLPWRASHSQASPHSAFNNLLNCLAWSSYPLLWYPVASVPVKKMLRFQVSQKVPLSKFLNSYLLCTLSSLLISSLSRFFLTVSKRRTSYGSLHFWTETRCPIQPYLTYKNVNFLWFNLINYGIVSK